MEPRNQILRKVKYRIYPESHWSSNGWNMRMLGETLLKISEEHPNAQFENIFDVVEDQRGFGSMEIDPIMETSYYILYTYYSPETDSEYESRMMSQEKIKQKNEEQEKLEYLRLKAKFEK